MSRTLSLRATLAAACAAMLIALPMTAPAGGQATPDGFDDYITFMATGTIPLGIIHPEIPGCTGDLFCDGEYFHKEIMRRSDAEIADEAQRAKDFMYNRFGLDVDVLVSMGDLLFQPFQIDPRGDYRAYSVAGEKVPPEGWVVRDGGFIATVIAADGIEMGGQFAGSGLVIPQNGLVLFGTYNIQTTNPNGKPNGEILVDYRSGMPMIANDFGEFVVNCQLSMDAFDDGARDGKAQGMGLVLLNETFTEMTLSWRNVLTIGGIVPEPGDNL